MHRKTVLLAQTHGFDVHTVFPRIWQDEYGRVEQRTEWAAGVAGLQIRPVDFIGRTNDPHRATYRTLDFGMHNFRPDVILAEEEPDSIAALHITAARAVFAPRAKLALYTWQNQERPLGRMVRAVQQIALRAADAVICANTEAIGLLQMFGYRRRTALIPANGLDTSVFTQSENTPHVLRFGYVGRLAVEKGIDDLLAAFDMLRDLDLHLTLVGDGPQRAALVERVAMLGLTERVTFAGALPSAQLVAAYHEMSALVLPSRTTPVWKEQFGRVLIEAMACGVPVIGASSGAIPEVIGGAGLIFPEGDAAALAAHMRRLATEPALAADLRRRGIERVRMHYTQERIASHFADLLREMHTA
jgi:glycosyltransferase involved in cell wall biosynthesis